jgi:hypothetical protein
MEKINLAQYRFRWQVVVNTVMNSRAPLRNLENAQFYSFNIFFNLRMRTNLKYL